MDRKELEGQMRDGITVLRFAALQQRVSGVILDEDIAYARNSTGIELAAHVLGICMIVGRIHGCEDQVEKIEEIIEQYRNLGEFELEDFETARAIWLQIRDSYRSEHHRLIPVDATDRLLTGLSA